MEIVTLVEVSLNRIGTAQGAGGAFRSNKSCVVFVEAEDAEVETVRDLVIKVAEENGETGALDGLMHEPRYGARAIVFNIQGGNVFHSKAYAECEVFPALKSGGRYFRLQEVQTSSRCR
ncbi:hypothetical protein ACRS5L_14905 [Metapseudomonas otitidis]|uniref:hypothetical protein n=1 Tax=Metapseudomonas otitidis TaxID=319939 RepID=UPI003EDEFC31